MSRLSSQEFLTVVSLTPLVSLDLIVMDQSGSVLLGERKNEPAKGYWFVPGGRIRKNESIQNALIRLMKDELGVSHYCGHYALWGIYNHFYDTCFTDTSTLPSTSTHYVSIGIQLSVSADDIDRKQVCDQHTHCRWVTVDQLMTDSLVHANTKRFFMRDASNLISF